MMMIMMMYGLMIFKQFLLFILLVKFIAVKAAKPNILIILADDLGWGDVSFHGTRQIPTPNIDLLASSGVILNNYYVSPLCSPSRSALLTGYHPIRTGMQIDAIAASQPYGLPLNLTTMGQYFKQLGYQTHLVGKWHQGFFRYDYLPTRRGFDTYFGYLNGHSDYFNRISSHIYSGYDLHENDHVANLSKYEGQYSTDMYTDRVIELIKDNQNKITQKPWLIYMAQQSVHGAEHGNEIQPPPRCENSHKYIKSNDRRRRFAGMVSALDESVGRVFKALNDTNQLSNTIIVFSTDNGGAIGGIDGNHIDHSEGSNWPLRGGKYTLWEGGVRGTAFIWSKLLSRKSYVNNQLFHITDILPTLYSAAGGNPKDLGDIDGYDQWNQLNHYDHHDNYKTRDHLLHNIDHLNDNWAIRYKNFKLIYGTIFKGNYDGWYEAPGQRTEHPSEGICYNCTKTFRILDEHQIQYELKTIAIDCNWRKNPYKHCNSTEFCLYDIQKDPCELTNLSDKRKNLIKKLYEKFYINYNEQYVNPLNKPYDPLANPQLHGGFWKPWIF